MSIVLQGGRGGYVLFKKKKSDSQFKEKQYGGKADNTKYSASRFSSIQIKHPHTSLGVKWLLPQHRSRSRCCKLLANPPRHCPPLVRKVERMLTFYYQSCSVLE